MLGLGGVKGLRLWCWQGTRLLGCLKYGGLLCCEIAVTSNVCADATESSITSPVTIPGDTRSLAGVQRAAVEEGAAAIAQCVVAILSAVPECFGSLRMVAFAIRFLVCVVPAINTFLAALNAVGPQEPTLMAKFLAGVDVPSGPREGMLVA